VYTILLPAHHWNIAGALEASHRPRSESMLTYIYTDVQTYLRSKFNTYFLNLVHCENQSLMAENCMAGLHGWRCVLCSLLHDLRDLPNAP
jgi:hypothetical protein